MTSAAAATGAAREAEAEAAERGHHESSLADAEAGRRRGQAADAKVAGEPQAADAEGEPPQAADAEVEGEPQAADAEAEVDPAQQLSLLEHKHSMQTCYFLYVYTVEILLRCAILATDGAIFQDYTGGVPCTRRDTRLVCSIPFATRLGFAIVFSFVLLFQIIVLAGIGLAACRIKKAGLVDLSADCQKMLIVLQLLTMVSFLGYTTFTAVVWSQLSRRTRELSIVIVSLHFLSCFYNERTRRLFSGIRRAFSDLRDAHARVIRRHELQRSMPSVPVRGLHGGAEQERECSICLDGFQPDDMATELPCGHFFHTACICEWLSDTRHSKCPLRCAQDPLPPSLAALSQVSPDVIGVTSSSAGRRA